jgi:hypothetical protein
MGRHCGNRSREGKKSERGVAYIKPHFNASTVAVWSESSLPKACRDVEDGRRGENERMHDNEHELRSDVIENLNAAIFVRITSADTQLANNTIYAIQSTHSTITSLCTS